MIINIKRQQSNKLGLLLTNLMANRLPKIIIEQTKGV